MKTAATLLILTGLLVTSGTVMADRSVSLTPNATISLPDGTTIETEPGDTIVIVIDDGGTPDDGGGEGGDPIPTPLE